MSARVLWPAAIAAVVIGTVLVFAAVTVPGLFTPGVVVIDVGLALALAAALVGLRTSEARPPLPG